MPTSDPSSFDLFNWLWTILSVPVLWVFNAMRSFTAKLDIAHKRISDHELHVAEKYVRHDSFTKLEERIFNKLDRIEAKLDDKADK